jgi:hypothetical protein
MRLATRVAPVVVLSAGLVAATTTCQFSDVLKAPGIEDVALSLSSDTILVVAAPIRLAVGVTVNGAPFDGARVALASSDTGIVAVHGDSLVPKRRGIATLTVTLESSALSRDPPSLQRQLVVVADTVTLDSAAVHLTSLGDTVTLAATARDALLEVIAGVAARWTSSDTNVVTVTPGGRLAAKGNGTATLRAVVDRDTAAAAVTVAQALTRFTFEPASLRIDALAATGAVAATGRDTRGNPIAALAPTAWSVGDATVLTVSAPGQVTSLVNGSTYLYATRGSVRDSLPVTVAQRAVLMAVTPRPVPPVTSLGAQVQLVARAFDRRGVEIQAAKPAWFSLDPNSVRVGTDGLVTALATGTARIIAALDAAADTASVVVSNDPATVAVAPDSAVATSIGDTLVFTATARNGRGDPVAATVAWRTPDSTIVRFLADGGVVGLAVGTARVIATVGSKADTSLAKVTNVPISIDITPPARVYTSLGDVDTLPVAITNARGAALPRGAANWSSDDATIARVSTGGVVTARDTGQTVVRATSGSVTDSVVVTVQNVPASIVVRSPAVDTLTAVGQSIVLPADVRNARGVSIASFPVAWRSTDRAAVDTVLPAGEAVAIGWGTTSLIAQAGPVADTVRLTVRNPTRLYVSNAIYSSPRVGTLARPYARIQDAVNGVDAGDTVVVLRGVSPYSESVALSRKVVLLGDSTAFVANRDPSLLPQLAHDTGTAAISANTTAPLTVKYLAISHTLDGPAFASDGSDVRMEWVYVNPPGSGTSRIGRGVSVRNSSSGTSLRNLRIRNVRGYGISLAGTSAAEVSGDSIIGVDSIGIPEKGAGIALEGGADVVVSANVIRATRGARILVRGAASASITLHVLSGRHPLIHLDSVTGLVRIASNQFQVGWDPYESGDDPDCSVDTRCAGILITDSRNGALHGGYSTLAYTSPADINGNVFYNANYPSVADGIGIRIRRSMAYGIGNQFRYLYYAHLLEGNSKGYFSNPRADTCQYLVLFDDADSVYVGGGVTHQAGAVSHFNEAAGGVSRIQFSNGSFSHPAGSIFHVWDTQTEALIEDADIVSAPNNQPVVFNGKYLTLYRVRVAGVGDTVPGYKAGSYYNAGVLVLGVDYLYLHQSRIEGFVNFPGLNLFGSIGSVFGDSNVVTRNRTGIYVNATVPGALALQGAGSNSVFDNLVAGLEDYRASSSGLPQWWWGDGRGPRRSTNLAATGDTVLGVTPPTLYLATPPQTGTVAAGMRHVRGTGQTAVRGTVLPKAFTVRVVDANGLPVAGVSVTFTVTAGGGNLAGLASRTVATNADGLAEVTLTLGSAAGGNTVVASSSGLGTVTFTATGT